MVKSIREVVEEWRIAQSMTKHEMAQALKMQDSNYSEFLAGRRELPKQALKRAYALGISADILLQPDKEPPHASHDR